MDKYSFEARIGKFCLSTKFFERHGYSNALKIMAHVLVTRAEFIYRKDVIEYIGYSMLFDKVLEGEEAPEYTMIVDTETGKVKAKKRQS